jgi:CheY-like chemotaxis protein
MQAMMITVPCLPDAVVLDISMPAGNGLDVLRFFRKPPPLEEVVQCLEELGVLPVRTKS